MQATVNLFADMANVQPQTLLRETYSLRLASQGNDDEGPADCKLEKVEEMEETNAGLRLEFGGSDSEGTFLYSGIIAPLAVLCQKYCKKMHSATGPTTPKKSGFHCFYGVKQKNGPFWAT